MGVEPVRSKLVSDRDVVRENAIDAHASGVTISGTGPPVIAVIDNAKASARSVAGAMRDVL